MKDRASRNLIYLLKIAEFIKPDRHCDLCRAGIVLPVESLPLPRGEHHRPIAGVFPHNWRHEYPISQKELILHSFLTLMGKRVLEGAHHGFPGRGGLPRQFEDVALVLLSQLNGFVDRFEVRGIEDTPGRHGELHHGHERMDLGGTHDHGGDGRRGAAANLILASIGFAALKMGLGAGVWSMPESLHAFDLLVGPVAGDGSVWDALGRFCSVLFRLNLLLCVFNLLPIPPMDGASVLAGLSGPVRALRDRLSAQPMFGLIGLLVAWQVFPYLFLPVYAVVLGWLYG